MIPRTNEKMCKSIWRKEKWENLCLMTLGQESHQEMDFQEMILFLCCKNLLEEETQKMQLERRMKCTLQVRSLKISCGGA